MITEKRAPAFCLAMQPSDKKANDCVRTTGKISILAGVLLIFFGLKSADLLQPLQPAASIKPMIILDPIRPISINNSFQSATPNGRISPAALIELPTTTQLGQDRRDLNLVHRPSEMRASPAVDMDLQQWSSNGPEDSKAIWLAIHQPEYELEWLDETFTISHYTYALESDPLYADDDTISVPGLPAEDKYKAGFIYGPRGILLQGTGLAENGRYITIDWDRSYHDPEDVTQNRWFFQYGIGRPVVPWKTVATHHPDLPQGTQIVIETYLGEHRFVVGDGGLDLAKAQIDVFVGNMTIAEADQLGVTWSRVAIIRPINYLLPDQMVDLAESHEVAVLAD